MYFLQRLRTTVSGDINKLLGEIVQKGTNMWQSAAADDKYFLVRRFEISTSNEKNEKRNARQNGKAYWYEWAHHAVPLALPFLFRSISYGVDAISFAN